MSVSYEEWSTAIDRVVCRALEAAEVDEPPVDTFCVAERLKHSVLIDDGLPVRGYRKQVGGESYILLGLDERSERMHFATAHELGESLAASVCLQVAEIELECVSERLREDLANRIASRLLCPNPWFTDDARRCGYDLLWLKQLYCTASHEVIGRRLLEVDDVPATLTVYDNQAVTLRLANFGRCPPPTSSEQQCWRRCHESAQAESDDIDGLMIQAWPVHEDGWKREILRTTAADQF